MKIVDFSSEYDDDDDDQEPYERAGNPFRSPFSGWCVIEPSHKVKRNSLVCKIRRTDNPLVPVSGVACEHCTRILPRGSM